MNIDKCNYILVSIKKNQQKSSVKFLNKKRN